MFLHNTSRCDDEKYDRLLQEKGFTGFPSLCFMDDEGNVIAKQGARTVDGFEATLAKVQEYVAVKQKAAKGGAEAEKALFLAQLDLDMLKPDELKAKADKLSLSDADKALVAQKLTDAEVAALQREVSSRKLPNDEFAAKLLEIAKQGRRPSESQARQFWNGVLTAAAAQKDAAMAESAVAELEKRAPEGPGGDAMKRRWRQLLDQAKN